MPETEQTGAVEQAVPAAIASALADGKIVKMADLAKAIAKPPKPVVRPSKVPVASIISDDESAALEKLGEVFCSVVPTEARKLTPVEVSKLLQERSTLKTVEKMLATRIADISLTVLNHNDTAFDDGDNDDTTEVLFGVDGDPLLNKDGHVVRKAKIYGDDKNIKTHFSVETRQGTPSVLPQRLEAMADNPEIDYIDHKDYLAMTSQVRVFDENKAMLYLKKNPNLLRAMREASSTSQAVVSVYQR